MSKRRRLNPTTIFDPVHREYELCPEIIDIIIFDFIGINYLWLLFLN